VDYNAKEIIIAYLTVLSGQDFKTARSYLNDNMTFQAPIASYDNADAYFKGNEVLRSKYGIERVTYEIKKVFVDGNDICTFFDFNVGPATMFACGWFQVKDGKISSIRVVFDPRPIAELTASQSPK